MFYSLLNLLTMLCFETLSVHKFHIAPETGICIYTEIRIANQISVSDTTITSSMAESPFSIHWITSLLGKTNLL